MVTLLYSVYYLMTGLATALTTFGVAIGQAKAASAAIEAINQQPAAKDDIWRTMTLSLALIETAGLLGFVISFILVFKEPTNAWSALASIGIALAISIPGLALGIIASLPGQSAILAIARQPFIAKKITNFMLLTQSVIQTALAFGFIIALIITTQLDAINNLAQAMAFITSGFCIAFGSIGPIFGLGLFTRSACKSVGLHKTAYTKLFSFTVISQAIIETPVIFAAIVSFWLIRAASLPITPEKTYFAIAIYAAAAFVMGIGTLAAGINSGKTAATACPYIIEKPEIASLLSRTSMLSQGIIDTTAIYAFLIAILLLIIPLQ